MKSTPTDRYIQLCLGRLSQLDRQCPENDRMAREIREMIRNTRRLIKEEAASAVAAKAKTT